MSDNVTYTLGIRLFQLFIESTVHYVYTVKRQREVFRRHVFYDCTISLHHGTILNILRMSFDTNFAKIQTDIFGVLENLEVTAII